MASVNYDPVAMDFGRITIATDRRQLSAPACRSSGRRQRGPRPRPQALICGVEDVIIHTDPNVEARIERSHGLPAGAIRNLMTCPSSLLATVGALEYPTWLRYAHQTLPPQAVDQYLTYRGTPNLPVVELLAAATDTGLRLFSLANNMRDDLTHHGLADLPERVYVSHDLAMAKPDPRVYDHILRTHRIQPAHTLLIDRDRACVDTARQLGIRAHTYTDPAELSRFLTEQTHAPDPAHPDIRQENPC